MKAADIRKRRRMLDELRTRIVAAPSSNKPRTVLRKPQLLLMEVGDVMVYPTCSGKNINPYYASKELNIHYTKNGRVAWKQDGWAAMVIVDCGRAFDFLSWYRAVRIAEARIAKPSLDSLRGQVPWILGLPGTCSASHFRKMELEKIGTLRVDREKLKHVFPGIRPGVSAAVKDISIANSMKAAPSVPGTSNPKPGEARKGLSPAMLGIEQILR